MRLLVVVLLLAATADIARAQSVELTTAHNAILCLGPENLHAANRPAVAKSQKRLRDMRCMRTDAGIPVTLLDGPEIGGPWRIRARPQGISAGVTIWALPSSLCGARQFKAFSAHSPVDMEIAQAPPQPDRCMAPDSTPTSAVDVQ
jgi:hypothetical protein